MKTRFFTFMVLAAVFAGCAKDGVDPTTEKELVPLTFKSEFVDENKVGDETKSYLAEQTGENGTYHIVTWNAYDKIAVIPVGTDGFVKDLTGEDYFTTTDGGVEATFAGTSVSADEYVGIYPASGDDYFDTKSIIVYKNLNNNQTATEGNLGVDMIPAITKPTSANEKLYFYNACGLIKFTIPEELSNITKVAFRGGNGEKLAGRIGIKYETEYSSISVWVEGTYENQESQYTLTVSNEDGSPLTPGGTYYMVSAPSSLKKGFTVAMYGADGKRYIKSTDKHNEIHRSKVMNLGTLDAQESTPKYENLYLLSNVSDWQFNYLSPGHSLDPFIFRFGAELKNGDEFKFATASGSFENMYKAFEASADPFKKADARFLSGIDDATDFNWALSSDTDDAKPYRIIVDITTGVEKIYTSEFTDYSAVKIVGDATPNGWSLDNATELNIDNDHTWTWTGELKEGEIKFVLNNNTDWISGKWLMSPKDGNNFESCSILYVDLNEHPGKDYKWKVTEAGNYTITINTLTEKLTVVKNEVAAEE